MTLPQRFHVAIMTAVTCLSAPLAGAQGLKPVETQQLSVTPDPGSNAVQTTVPDGAPDAFQGATQIMRRAPRMRLQTPSGSTAAITGQSIPSATLMPGVTAAPEAAPASGPKAHSMLDEPATPAQIQMSGDRLSINAANASLSEVIRQVAKDTGMQVEGNSRDERVFGSYGPGSPPEVLSALLYDSGYNVIMVGSTADGAPRRLVLSTRAAATSTQAAVTQARNSDDEDEEPPAQEVAPAPPPNPIMQAAPGVPPASGQPKTPQQMLEELQRMHQGQQAPELPHE